MSRGALRTLELESELHRDDFLNPAVSFVHPIGDIAATIASGSFVTAGMVVIPCSMKTLAGIVHGYSDKHPWLRWPRGGQGAAQAGVAARLSLSSLHLEKTPKASQLGAVIMPPMLTFDNHHMGRRPD